MPKFSVIIPLYNKESHILKSIKSVFQQRFLDYEIVIVNDGSTDNSYDLVKELSNPKIFHYTKENNGVSSARNFAMQHAKGDYFAFLDADDIWNPNHLEILNNLITKFPKCGLYATNYTFDYGDFKVNTKFPTLPENDDWDGIIQDFFSASLLYRVAWTSSVVIPKNTFLTLGGFNTTINHGEDIEYWCKIALNYQIAFTKKISAYYIINSTNKLSNINLKKRKTMNFEVFIEEEKENPSLKKFNDMYRYQYALEYKMNNDLKSSNTYLEDLDWKNLNLKKKIIIKLSPSILLKLWKVKQWLKTKQVDFYI